MDFSKLFIMQKQLDSYIEGNQGLNNVPLLENKLMAFQVEVAELANETRCFKFWSEKARATDEVILEEYVDGIHFLLSVGIEYKFNERYTYDYPKVKKTSEAQLVNDFFQVIDLIQKLRKDPTQFTYEQLFDHFLKIGANLGFHPDDIIHAYFQKNKINHQRQDQRY